MKAPAFQFYVRDWLGSGKVELASREAIKAYVYLLCRAWLEDPRGTLPMNDKILSKYSRLSMDEWLRVKDEVVAFFKEGTCEKHSGRLFSERLLEVSNLSSV